MASIDTPLVRVPYDALRKASRERKHLVDESAAVLSTLKAEMGGSGTADDTIKLLDSLIFRVQGLKRKSDEVSKLEEQNAHRCKVRLNHLCDAGPVPKAHVIEWNRPRLDRLLVEHLMRTGCIDTAVQLAEVADIKDLVDIDTFTGVRLVMDGLRHQDCAAALEWCSENHAKLKKQRSKLEFRLHVQRFVELIRAEEVLPALVYAQQHLAPHAPLYMAELQQATALLAFRAGTTCQPYAGLLDQSQWGAALELFLQELFHLHSLPPHSLLEVHLQAGLSALKTPQSYSSKASKEDPLHHKTFQALAEGLPRAKHVHSKLVCTVTGQIMDEHNAPMVMPNGTVHSEAAVRLLTGPDGRTFTCPKSGASCDISDLQRAFMS